MGAEEFYNVGKGATAGEAFSSLVDAARYANGHEGYTGSIAEKSEFTLLSVDSEAERCIGRLKETLECYTVKEQKRLAKQAADIGKANRWSDEDYDLHDRIEAVRVWVSHDETLGAACTRKRKQIRATIAKLKKKKGRAEAVAEALMYSDDKRVNDKWGPACCVPLGNGEYAFFGWASS